MIFHKILAFNAGFIRFFESLENWILLHGMTYSRLKQILGRRPTMTENYHERFFRKL